MRQNFHTVIYSSYVRPEGIVSPPALDVSFVDLGFVL